MGRSPPWSYSWQLDACSCFIVIVHAHLALSQYKCEFSRNRYKTYTIKFYVHLQYCISTIIIWHLSSLGMLDLREMSRLHVLCFLFLLCSPVIKGMVTMQCDSVMCDLFLCSCDWWVSSLCWVKMSGPCSIHIFSLTFCCLCSIGQLLHIKQWVSRPPAEVAKLCSHTTQIYFAFFSLAYRLYQTVQFSRQWSRPHTLHLSVSLKRIWNSQF